MRGQQAAKPAADIGYDMQIWRVPPLVTPTLKKNAWGRYGSVLDRLFSVIPPLGTGLAVLLGLGFGLVGRRRIKRRIAARTRDGR